MASLFDKVAKIARSPKGQQAIDQASRKAQELAKDPATRARLEQVKRRFGKRA